MSTLQCGPVGRSIIQINRNPVCCSGLNYSTTSSKIVEWLQRLTVCSRANKAPIYILTSEMCSSHQYAAIPFIFVPFHLHNADSKIQILVVEN